MAADAASMGTMGALHSMRTGRRHRLLRHGARHANMARVRRGRANDTKGPHTSTFHSISYRHA
eukprot:131010-Prymnesium_polylepis.1